MVGEATNPRHASHDVGRGGAAGTVDGDVLVVDGAAPGRSGDFEHPAGPGGSTPERLGDVVAGLRRELRAGAGVVPLLEVLAALQSCLETLDPGQVTPRAAVDVVRVADRIERVAAAAKGTAAGRVADSSLWRRGGHRSPAHWMAATTGVSVADATRLIQTAQVSEHAPAGVGEAIRWGRVSNRKGAAIGTAAQADPTAGQNLLEQAERMSLGEVESEANRIRTAASPETDHQRATRHHRARRIRSGINADGMGWGSWLMPLAEHAVVLAEMAPGADAAYRAARAAGVHEPAEAYQADGLIALAHHHATCPHHDTNSTSVDRNSNSDTSSSTGDNSDNGAPLTTSAVPGPDDVGSIEGVDPDGSAGNDPGNTATAGVDPGGGGGAGQEGRTKKKKRRRGRWGDAKIIIRVDHPTLARGQLAPGEICEIAGHGPIPVTQVWDMIDDGAFVAAITTHGTRIDHITHLGRRPTALQRTALQWLHNATCAIEGCTTTARLEIDHTTDWAATHTTRLPDLTPLCAHHHRLKTHHGYTISPLQPNGTRHLTPPPEHAGPPDGEPGPPDLAGPLDQPPATEENGASNGASGPARPDTRAGPTDTDQPHLFDTS